ncbi:hypothetical protein M769_0114540 [Bacillus haynesii]|nr:hypothetical protein M769_0114540 [Bacillus haynesii]
MEDTNVLKSSWKKPKTLLVSVVNDEAFRLWKESNGTKKLKHITDELGVSSSTVRKWKATDKWEDNSKGALLFVKKRGKPLRSKGLPLYI